MASTASSSAAILSTMKHVTSNKWSKAATRLNEINRHVQLAEASIASDLSTDPQVIAEGITALIGMVRKAFAGTLDTCVPIHNVNIESRLKAIERMLSNAKYSSGFSSAAALSWRDELKSYLYQGQRRMEYTILFGRLTEEWADFRFGELSESQQSKKNKDVTKEVEADTVVAVGRKEMHEQRQTWEGLVTNLRSTDKPTIIKFLDDLFHVELQDATNSVEELTDLRHMSLQKLRKKMAGAFKNTNPISASTVKNAIDAILGADQLTSEKRRAMIDLKSRDNVLTEIADILNIDARLASLDGWTWGDRPITAQMRKAINGKYRIYMDIELLDSILIQCVGQRTAIHIAQALDELWDPDVRDVWKVAEDEDQTAAIELQLPDFSKRSSDNSVQILRRSIYRNRFFVPQLPRANDSQTGASRSYDDDDTSDGGMGFSDLLYSSSTVHTIKTDILRVCAAEMAVQKLVHGQFCILQSDFRWFGPSLPHSTLVTVLEYFKFPKELVNFIKAFLDMRMKFEEDGKDGEVFTRKTGIPVSFQLTDGISELLLFILDFAVHKNTGGAHLYRNHDDLWFWGQPSQCAAAWDTIKEFTNIMGLQLNDEKTGFAHAVDKSNPRFEAAPKSDLDRLPKGKVKWGFLMFDETAWKWAADKESIENHMDELRFQLKSRTSVMSHIQAYNAYMKNFLPNNFGQVFVGLGDEHPIMVLEALQYAQQQLYRSTKGEASAANVASHLRQSIQDRFGAVDGKQVPDCFLYMKVESGGLGLANPAPAFARYIPLPSDNEDTGKDLPPMEDALKTMHDGISSGYRDDKESFTLKLSNKRQRRKLDRNANESENKAAETQFMTFSKYMATTERRSYDMNNFYKAMMEAPSVANSETALSNQNWASSMFSSEIREYFGGHIAEEEFLSIGLYRTLAEEKARWTG